MVLLIIFGSGFMLLIPLMFLYFVRDAYIKQKRKEALEQREAERQAFLDEWGSDENYFRSVLRPRGTAERAARERKLDKTYTDERERWRMRRLRHFNWSDEELSNYYDNFVGPELLSSGDLEEENG